MRTLIVSAALLGAFAMAQPAAAQSTSQGKAFCLVQSGGGSGPKQECRYDTLAQCQASAKGMQGEAKCEKNSKAM